MPIFLRRILFILIVAGIVYGVYWVIDKNNSYDEKEETPIVEQTTANVVTSGVVDDQRNVAPGGDYPEITEEGNGTGTLTETDQEDLLDKDVINEEESQEATSGSVTTGTTKPVVKTTTKKPTTTPKTTNSTDTILGELF